MAKRTIMLRGPFEYYEYPADAAITPGDRVMLNSDGELARNTVVTAGVQQLTIIAGENTMLGKTIDDDYAANDTVRGFIPGTGAKVLITVADGQTIVKGDSLAPDGAGKYIKLNQGVSAEAEFVADEAVTTSGAVGRIAAIKI